MYPFSESVSPAVRTHLDAQTNFLNAMSKSMFRSFQQVCDLNIQLMQTMLEETTMASQQLLTADRQGELWQAAASRAQPMADKLRAYQQHISRLAADAQVDIARVTEQHVQNTTRTARTLADEVARHASEETERGLRAQQETVRRFADPFFHSGNGSAGQSQMWAEPGPGAAGPGQPGGEGGIRAGSAQHGTAHGNGGAGPVTTGSQRESAAQAKPGSQAH